MGGFMSLIFRLQLGFPEMSLEWLRPILGGWITEAGKLDTEFYILDASQGTTRLRSPSTVAERAITTPARGGSLSWPRPPQLG